MFTRARHYALEKVATARSIAVIHKTAEEVRDKLLIAQGVEMVFKIFDDQANISKAEEKV